MNLGGLVLEAKDCECLTKVCSERVRGGWKPALQSALTSQGRAGQGAPCIEARPTTSLGQVPGTWHPRTLQYMLPATPT